MTSNRTEMWDSDEGGIPHFGYFIYPYHDATVDKYFCEILDKENGWETIRFASVTEAIEAAKKWIETADQSLILN